MKTTIMSLWRKKPKLKNAVLITGLPGIGLIGRTVAIHLIEALKGKKIAEIYSPHFPHEAIMHKDGTLTLVGGAFYRIQGKKRDVIVLVGDVQAISSIGQYEVATEVLNYVEKLGIKEIITIGGYSAGRVLKKGRIFGVVNTESMRKTFENLGVIFGAIDGAVVGIAGLLPALARFRNIPSICILGETHGVYVDVIAARQIVELLAKYLNIKIDMTDIEEKAREIDENDF